MKTMKALVKRNFTLFFKDKGVFFVSLITPLILLVLYVTFLGDVYRDVFLTALPEALGIPEKVINGLVGGQLLSSLLAVSCVTVSFCANMLMVADKATGVIRDLTVTPVKPGTLAISYYLATLGSALTVNLVALAAGLGYLGVTGWYLSVGDVARMVLDVVLLVMFGTALSSVINHFLRSQGQISAVGTIVSSGYGFICGAYMPISNFAPGLQKVLSFLPGTYGTALLRSHAMNGAFLELEKRNVPEAVLNDLRSGVDCSIEFFGSPVPAGAMYTVLIGAVVLMMAVYILLSGSGRKQK